MGTWGQRPCLILLSLREPDIVLNSRNWIKRIMMPPTHPVALPLTIQVPWLHSGNWDPPHKDDGKALVSCKARHKHLVDPGWMSSRQPGESFREDGESGQHRKEGEGGSLSLRPRVSCWFLGAGSLSGGQAAPLASPWPRLRAGQSPWPEGHQLNLCSHLLLPGPAQPHASAAARWVLFTAIPLCAPATVSVQVPVASYREWKRFHGTRNRQMSSQKKQEKGS